MRPGVVVVEEVEGQACVAVATGGVAAGIGPLPGEGLDEAFGFAVGLGPVGSGEAVFDAQVPAGVPEAERSVGGAVVGEDRFDLDPVEGKEAEHLLEGADDAGDLLVGVDAGEAQAGVIVDGDMEGFVAGADAAIGTVAGAAHARSFEAAELLNIEMDEFARGFPLVADDRRRGGIERLQEIDAVAPEDPPDGGLGDRHQHDDLGIGAALAAQPHYMAFKLGGRSPGLTFRNTGVFAHPLDNPFESDAGGPAPDRFLADTAGGCSLPQCQTLLEVLDHLGSTPRGELGISVHVVRAVGL